MKFLTWNLWFGDFERDRRLGTALEIVRRERADIVAFQEVVPDTLEHMWATPWIRDDYHLTDYGGETFGLHYGTVLMSRLPIEALHVVVLPSEMGRRLIAVDLVLEDSRLRVGGVHLDSGASTTIRTRQLREILTFLSDADAAVLMGDMNFDDGDPEHEQLPAGVLDLWRHLHPTERGATRDTDANLMAALHSKTPKTRRIDRIFLMAGTTRWKPRSIRVIGTDPIGDDPGLFPSDHFGLVADLEQY
jgi:endonuclease/exonuclease/phosphatase family metal-dependent hydrolase